MKIYFAKKLHNLMMENDVIEITGKDFLFINCNTLYNLMKNYIDHLIYSTATFKDKDKETIESAYAINAKNLMIKLDFSKDNETHIEIGIIKKNFFGRKYLKPLAEQRIFSDISILTAFEEKSKCGQLHICTGKTKILDEDGYVVIGV